MPLVSQETDNLLGGVSQQAVTQRSANQVEEQVNALATIGSGLSKRPPSQHSSVIRAVPDITYNAVHTHAVSRSSTDRYRVVLSNGDLKVFDVITGVEQVVTFPQGKGYLTTADPSRNFRCVTIGEYTYITNGSVNVLRGTTASAVAVNEALVSVRQADYNTTFSVTIDGVTLTYTSPDGSTPATMRDDIATDRIAVQLKTLIDASAALPNLADCVQYGSTLYIKRTDGADFSISATDGIADAAIIAIKGSVQSFDQLPAKARHGFVVEIIGDPTNALDNYFVKYDASGTPNKAGVWKETVKPGILTTLDASTMPHQLVRGEVLKQGLVGSGVPPAPTIIFFNATTWYVSIEPDASYPAGYITQLQLGVSPALQQVSAVDQTGAQVSIGLAALVNGTGSYLATIVSPGLFFVTTNPAGTPFSISATYIWDNATKFYCPDMALVVNALIGKVVQNSSDGSTGTVTGNSANVIVVGALTGGGTNKFLKGDLIDVVGTATDYVFSEALWKPRKVGGMDTVPYPSFVGKPVKELFYANNRLGFTSSERVVTSRVGDYLNLFRETATQLLPSDPIDVVSASQNLANFHSAVHWDEGVLLWSDKGQYALEGDPLTPETIGLKLKTEFVNSSRLRPVAAGRRIFFSRAKGTSTRVYTYALTDNGSSIADAEDITKHIPTYILGTPIQMVAEEGFLAVLTEADQSKLYVYSYAHASQTLVQSDWSRWEFAAGTRIVSMDLIDGKLGLHVSRPGGVYIESIDLDPSAV